MSAVLVNIRTVDDQNNDQVVIVHIVTSSEEEADRLITGFKRDLDADPADIASAPVRDDWECRFHDDGDLRCGMPRLN